MDIVFVRELGIDTVIGVHGWERRIRQTVILDLEMATDSRRAAAADRLEDALDYAAVSERLRTFIANSDVHLIETLAERAADIVQREFGVCWLRLRLSKPGAVAGAREVGIVIERGAKP